MTKIQQLMPHLFATLIPFRYSGKDTVNIYGVLTGNADGLEVFVAAAVVVVIVINNDELEVVNHYSDVEFDFSPDIIHSVVKLN